MTQSLIHYKFKASKDSHSVVFDGLGLSVAELKREILLQKKLRGTDFDLLLSNADGSGEYRDDDIMIPRNSSILVRRVPVQKRPGQITGAAKYTGELPSRPSVIGTGGVVMGSAAVPGLQVKGDGGKGFVGLPGRGAHSVVFGRNSRSATTTTTLAGGVRGVAGNGARHPASSSSTSGTAPANWDIRPQDPAKSLSTPAQAATGEDDEMSKIKAMFEQTNEHWEKEQEKMAGMRRLAGPRSHGGRANSRHPGSSGATTSTKDGNHTNRTPPPNYVCFRCGEKGHFIQVCPTNNDRSFDRPKVKRTTGIPRSFLREVKNPMETLQERAKGQGVSGVMITKDGKVVQAVANESEWQKIKARTKAPVGLSEQVIKNAPSPPNMRCYLCDSTMVEAVKVDCCATSFCSECIQNAITHEGENHLKCPNCKKHITLDHITPELDLRISIETWVSDYVLRKQREEREKEKGSTPAGATRAAAGTSGTRDGDGEKKGSSKTAASTASGKKRKSSEVKEEQDSQSSGPGATRHHKKRKREAHPGHGHGPYAQFPEQGTLPYDYGPQADYPAYGPPRPPAYDAYGGWCPPPQGPPGMGAQPPGVMGPPVSYYDEYYHGPPQLYGPEFYGRPPYPLPPPRRAPRAPGRPPMGMGMGSSR